MTKMDQVSQLHLSCLLLRIILNTGVFVIGAYNMGGSPANTVEKIKNLVYMDQGGEGGTRQRDEFLGKFYFQFV